MKKKMYKWLSFILAFALCAGCFSTGVLADEPGVPRGKEITGGTDITEKDGEDGAGTNSR